MEQFLYFARLRQINDENMPVIEENLGELMRLLSKEKDKFGFYLKFIYPSFNKLKNLGGEDKFEAYRRDCVGKFPPACLSLEIVVFRAPEYVKIYELPSIVGLKLLKNLRKYGTHILLNDKNIDYLFNEIIEFDYDLNKVKWAPGEGYYIRRISGYDICEKNMGPMQESFNRGFDQVDHRQPANNNINFILWARHDILRTLAQRNERNLKISQ